MRYCSPEELLSSTELMCQSKPCSAQTKDMRAFCCLMDCAWDWSMNDHVLDDRKAGLHLLAGGGALAGVGYARAGLLVLRGCARLFQLRAIGTALIYGVQTRTAFRRGRKLARIGLHFLLPLSTGKIAKIVTRPVRVTLALPPLFSTRLVPRWCLPLP